MKIVKEKGVEQSRRCYCPARTRCSEQSWGPLEGTWIKETKVTTHLAKSKMMANSTINGINQNSYSLFHVPENRWCRCFHMDEVETEILNGALNNLVVSQIAQHWWQGTAAFRILSRYPHECIQDFFLGDEGQKWIFWHTRGRQAHVKATLYKSQEG